MSLTLICFVGLLFVEESFQAWTPSPGTTFQWQLQESINTHVAASVYDIDLFNAKDSDFHTLKSHGHKIICYFSAGTHENWRHDAHSFPHSTLGNALPEWKGERWLDIRSPQVKSIMEKRLDLARSRGCDAVEPDNVDGYANNNGMGLHRADQIHYNTWLAHTAHAKGLSIGLKNALSLIPELVSLFDWALNESCLDYDECDEYQPFLHQHKAVFHVEYVDSHTDGPAKQRSVCHSSHRPHGFTTLIKDWDLTAWRLTC
ncbi:uncharacterized protein LOC121372890 [Gigantopelta aegis]|uniref:uncharacterized protein LOC121372890 n=1 Tax=Gigantopelta aegis TaxID=1735272 RepID=UPI001B88CB6E|nr:uncharacterized protein LOC121372890 [Gigantopelta aegis]